MAEKVGGSVNVQVSSGIKSLILLKTTQSGFENFHRDEFRALGDTNDRLVGTSVDAEWRFSAGAIAARPDYEAVNKEILDTMVDEFAGPADKGVYSVSVQQTLYDMAVGVLDKAKGVEKIELYMVGGLLHNVGHSLCSLLCSPPPPPPPPVSPTNHPHTTAQHPQHPL